MLRCGKPPCMLRCGKPPSHKDMENHLSCGGVENHLWTLIPPHQYPHTRLFTRERRFSSRHTSPTNNHPESSPEPESVFITPEGTHTWIVVQDVKPTMNIYSPPIPTNSSTHPWQYMTLTLSNLTLTLHTNMTSPQTTLEWQQTSNPGLEKRKKIVWKVQTMCPE